MVHCTIIPNHVSALRYIKNQSFSIITTTNHCHFHPFTSFSFTPPSHTNRRTPKHYTPRHTRPRTQFTGLLSVFYAFHRTASQPRKTTYKPDPNKSASGALSRFLYIEAAIPARTIRHSIIPFHCSKAIEALPLASLLLETSRSECQMVDSFRLLLTKIKKTRNE